jgi:phenylacetic acid degradation operon negative regulatory protein
MKKIKFNKFRDSALGIFLANIKNFNKEYSIDIVCFALAGKGGNPYKIKRRLLGLTRDGYFDISEKNNKSFFRLTSKGLSLIELLKFSAGKLKWDRKWRVLIFDIPEEERYKRNVLRIKLLEFGFKRLQESVWITPHPLPGSFDEVVKGLRVRPYLYVMTVDAINREDELKKYFKLR